MSDIAILFSLISLFAGVASISISIFINQKYKKRVLELFIVFNLSFFLIQSSITLILYGTRVEKPAEFIFALSKIFDATGTSLSSFCGMLFMNYLLGIKISKSKKWAISVISICQLIAVSICSVYNILHLEYIIKVSILLVIFYEILITMINYKRIGNKDLKKAVNIFAIISIIFLPLFVFEYARPYIPLLQDIIILKTLSLPLYFLIINVFSLIFASRYFNSPNFIERDKLTEFFIKKYSITEQETNVIELLLAGLTYKQIAEKLYISNKTVDNHVQNIYRKLEVTSKIQLFNLVHSKEQ